MFETDVYLGALRRSWRLLLVLVVVLVAVAVLLPVSSTAAKPKTNKYHWDAAALVGAEPADAIGNSGVTNNTIIFFGNLYYAKYAAAKATGQLAHIEVLAPLMSASSAGVTSISPTSPTATTATKASKKAAAVNNVVKLVAPGTTAALASKLANAYSTAVGKEIEAAYQARLQATTTSKSGTPLPPTSGFQVVEPSFPSTATHVVRAPASFTNSRKARVLIGLVAGLLLGALIVLIRELLDKSIKTKSRAQQAFGFPVISEFPAPGGRDPGGSDAAGLDVWSDPTSVNAETYRLLRISVNFEELAEQDPADPFAAASAAWQAAPKGPYQPPEPGSRKVIMVASAGNEETRAIVAANLAATYSEAGQPVIVIGTADIGSGRAGDDAVPTVTGPADIEPYLQPSSLEHVTRLSLRPFVTGSSQLVNKAPEVLAAARQMADLVIIDAGPILAVHHLEALAHVVDATLLVAECRITKEADARRAGELIRRIGVPVLGIVLTNEGATGRRPRRPTAAPAVEAPAAAPAVDAAPAPAVDTPPTPAVDTPPAPAVESPGGDPEGHPEDGSTPGDGADPQPGDAGPAPA